MTARLPASPREPVSQLPVTHDRNVFSIGRRRHDEDQLTEMLAWLFSVVPEVAVALVELALGERPAEAEEIEFSTQHWIEGGRLDAVLTAPPLVVVVESKLQSDYGADQLSKYLDWIAAEHAERDRRALMTLTRADAPWPASDAERARELGIVPAPRRWEQLHDLLAPIANEPTRDAVAARLVREFLDMLTEEGLIPMKELAGDELGDAWSKSRAVIIRYHDFFRACKAAIAEQLGGEASSNSRSASVDYTWQDFLLPSGVRVVVGIWYTDEGVPLKPPVYKDAPIVWMAALAEHWPDWEAAAKRLEERPPEGWRLRGERWWGRPEVWCYLSEAVGEGAFDQQLDQFAAVCSRATAWLEAARDATEATP